MFGGGGSDGDVAHLVGFAMKFLFQIKYYVELNIYKRKSRTSLEEQGYGTRTHFFSLPLLPEVPSEGFSQGSMKPISKNIDFI